MQVFVVRQKAAVLAPWLPASARSPIRAPREVPGSRLSAAAGGRRELPLELLPGGRPPHTFHRPRPGPERR
eukprot:5513913-Pyramimonas_sp.AAC.1